MLEPIIRSIEVPCSQEKAFGIFLEGMDNWWPLERFSVSIMSGGTAKGLRVDAQVGGKIVEIGPDDTEHLWGTIKVYDPHHYVSMDFHINHPDYKETEGFYSLVEIRFTALAADRTRVELTQSNWEAFGEMAEGLYGGYGGGWTMIFEQAYKAACGG